MGLIKAANTPASVAMYSMKSIEEQARAMLARAQTRAEELIMEAQLESDNLRRNATAEGLVEGRATGHAQGLEEGKNAGHQQALNEHKVQLTNLVKTLTSVMTDLNAQRRDLEAAGVHEVVDLACRIAQKVTKRQAAVDPQVLAENLVSAMRLVVHSVDVKVAVHPSQKKYLVEALPRLQLSWPVLEHVETIDDPTLSVGGCRIFTRNGQIDADLDTQLQRLIDELIPPANDQATMTNKIPMTKFQ